MKSRQKEIRVAPNSGRSIFRTSKNARKNDEIRKLGKRLRKQRGVAKVLIDSRSKFDALSQASHRYVRESTIAVYAAARLLVEDKSSWKEFCRHPEWRERKRLAPRVSHPEDALRTAARIAAGFDCKRATRRASRLYRLLKPFFVHGTSLREVASIVSDGGLKRLTEVGATFQEAKKAPSKSAKTSGCRFTLKNHQMADKILTLTAGTKCNLFAKVKKMKGGAREIIIYRVGLK